MKKLKFWLSSALLTVALSAGFSMGSHGLVFAQRQVAGHTNIVGGVFICDCTAASHDCVCLLPPNEN